MTGKQKGSAVGEQDGVQPGRDPAGRRFPATRIGADLVRSDPALHLGRGPPRQGPDRRHPSPPHPGTTGRAGTAAGWVPPAAYLTAARAALRVLAATGPLTTPTLAVAVARSHRFRHRETLSPNDFTAALVEVGGTLSPDGRWHPPAGISPPEKYRAIITQVAGRDLTRQPMIDILITAGYSPSSATGRMISSHPLFERIGPDSYRLITEPNR